MTDQDIEILRSIVKEWKDAAWNAKVTQANADALLALMDEFIKSRVNVGKFPASFNRNGVECVTKSFPILFCDTVLMEKK